MAGGSLTRLAGQQEVAATRLKDDCGRGELDASMRALHKYVHTYMHVRFGQTRIEYIILGWADIGC